jgi:hypothetical protein
LAYFLLEVKGLGLLFPEVKIEILVANEQTEHEIITGVMIY